MAYIPRPEHMKIMKSFFGLIKDDVLNIADIGTGRTSLYTLGKYFGYARIDAYYNDDNLAVIDGIKKDIESVRYKLVKMDITTHYSKRMYDLCLAHLVVSRGLNRGKTEQQLLDGIFRFTSKYLVLIDEKYVIKEDIEKFARKYGYKLLSKISPPSSYRMHVMGGGGDEGYLFEKA